MSDKSGPVIWKNLLSHPLGSLGDILPGSIFMSNLWVAKNLEIGMFTPGYIQVEYSQKNRKNTEQKVSQRNRQRGPESQKNVFRIVKDFNVKVKDDERLIRDLITKRQNNYKTSNVAQECGGQQWKWQHVFKISFTRNDLEWKEMNSNSFW